MVGLGSAASTAIFDLHIRLEKILLGLIGDIGDVKMLLGFRGIIKIGKNGIATPLGVATEQR